MNSKPNILSQQFQTLKKIPQTRSSTKINQEKEPFGQGDESSQTVCKILTQHQNTLESSISPQCYLLTAADCKRILEQNEGLKNEVRRLNDLLQLKRNRQLRSLERVKTETNEEDSEYEDEKKHLKKIIAKSYFSIREMQKKIQILKKSLKEAENKMYNFQHKYRLLELENQSLEHKLADTKQIHREQIYFCTERTQKLEQKIEKIVKLMEQDQYEWRKHQEQLQKLKKFYFKRTFH